MKVEQAKQIASKAIEQLSQALEAGHSEKLREYLAAMARFHRYSLRNIMLIASQRPDASHVAGFQTWKQLGRFVKKGAKGILILAPIVLRKDAESNNHEEQTERTAIRFRAVYVFDVVDTDGRPLPELGAAEGDPSSHSERLKEFIASRGIQLEYSEAIYPAQGQCSPGKIVLLPGQSAAEEFATLAHETGHALLHGQARRSKTTKTVRETEAEAVAFVVCEAIGLKAQNSADYIQLYSGSKETLAESLEHVQRASAEILAAITPTD
ncbi:MAG TPA: ArdC family protein [Candidatus Acidoferrales bacterium]|jgi:antirestriction protein ArdC|nr:ArdC family protein [Candidatus Acidoferrales bacterium]